MHSRLLNRLALHGLGLDTPVVESNLLFLLDVLNFQAIKVHRARKVNLVQQQVIDV